MSNGQTYLRGAADAEMRRNRRAITSWAGSAVITKEGDGIFPVEDFDVAVGPAGADEVGAQAHFRMHSVPALRGLLCRRSSIAVRHRSGEVSASSPPPFGATGHLPICEETVPGFDSRWRCGSP